MLSCDAGKVGPSHFEPHCLGVRKEGAPKETRKEELGAGEAETAGSHFVVDDERKSPCFKSTLLKYSLHPVKFTKF